MASFLMMQLHRQPPPIQQQALPHEMVAKKQTLLLKW
jgi:hypothetical protein